MYERNDNSQPSAEEMRQYALDCLPPGQQVDMDFALSISAVAETLPIPEHTSHKEIRAAVGETVREFRVARAEGYLEQDFVYHNEFVPSSTRPALIMTAETSTFNTPADHYKFINTETGASAAIPQGTEATIETMGFYGANPTSLPADIAEALGLGESSIPEDDPVRRAALGEEGVTLTTFEQFSRFFDLETAQVISPSVRRRMQPTSWRDAQAMMRVSCTMEHREGLDLSALEGKPFRQEPSLSTDFFVFHLVNISKPDQAIIARAIEQPLPLQLRQEGEARRAEIASTYQVLLRHGLQASSEAERSPLLTIAEKIAVDDEKDREARDWGVLALLEHNQNHDLAPRQHSPEEIYAHMPTLIDDMLETYDRQSWGFPVGWQRNNELRQIIALYREIADSAKS